MNPAMTCVYDRTKMELTVKDPVMAMSIAKELSFKVSRIRNPYSARPRGDFWIRTVNESGYTIDASDNMTLTITDYG